MRRSLLIGCAVSLLLFAGSPAAAKGKTAADLVNAGEAALSARDFDRAISLFTKALNSGELSKTDQEHVYVERGRADLGAGRAQDAQDDFRRAVNIDDAEAIQGMETANARLNYADVAPMPGQKWLPAPTLDPPALTDTPPLDLPKRFCSADERNAYHDGTYRPLKDAANANAEAAAAYLKRLDVLIERYKADVAYDGLKAEWRKWKQIYDARFARSVEIGRQFDALMAVPIGCS
jgi:tetratricopeptide (TPR) repeat protein